MSGQLTTGLNWAMTIIRAYSLCNTLNEPEVYSATKSETINLRAYPVKACIRK